MNNLLATGPVGVWHSVHQFSAPEEFTDAVAGATMKVDFLAPHQAVARIERFAGVDWAIDRFDAGVTARIQGDLHPRHVALCLVPRGNVMRQYGAEIPGGVLLCNPPGVPIDGFIAPGFRGIAVSLPEEVWEECRRVSGSRLERMAGFRLIVLPPSIFHDLATLHAETTRYLAGREGRSGSHTRAGSAFGRAMALAAWEHGEGQKPIEGSPRNRFRLARRAEAWMRAHLGEPFSIPLLCLDLGVSRRELEYAFLAAFGESPRAFLESLRLNAVRAALRRASPGESVTEIAFAHGLSHLGRFSARYRSLFGEFPSGTLSSGRRLFSAQIG